MTQFSELKAQAGDALLLFRMGDFYELFGDDAVVAAALLGITLTTRDKGKADAQPMAGVPHHSINGYIQKLLRNGKKVAIADQLEDPATVKAGKIVKRGITRILTPGIQFDLDSQDPVYLALALPMDDSEKTWAMACLDASTGELLTSSGLSREGVQSTLSRLPVRHWIHWGIERAWDFGPATYCELLPATGFTLPQARELLVSHYGAQALEVFFDSESAQWAAGILVQQVLKTQGQAKLPHLQRGRPLVTAGALTMGTHTAQHLDLFPLDPQVPSLFAHINRTRSAPGARTLRRWMAQPLRDPSQIRERQEGIQGIPPKVSSEFSEVYDLERIAGRIATGLANPRDTLALGRSLGIVPNLLRWLESCRDNPWLERRRALLEQHHLHLGRLSDKILTTQREDAPLTVRDGGIFKSGFHEELDRLVALNENGTRWLVELETRERETTGIPSLKVRYNRVFGYYIEVTQAHSGRVPAHYQRKQTMVGAERFFTEELKKFEEEILTASSRQKALELELFEQLVAAVREQLPLLMELAQSLAELDAAASLQLLSQDPGWTFPIIDDSDDLTFDSLRHPMVDQALKGGFVPNSLELGAHCRTFLITGPNMGGKSTVMRQVALAIVLGQMGGPVPAKNARWGWFGSVYTRIGAHDAIARGQSTFMVEMSELAHLLHHSDSRSLLILDEIGRGTSTYDGISVAWSTLEWICKTTRARTLFATHYHELTALSDELPGLANFHMAVESSKSGARANESFRFLYELRRGPASESFGIQVAALAGLPRGVIQRAWEVLDQLEGQHAPAAPLAPSDQLSFFGLPSAASVPPAQPEPPHPAVVELAQVDPNQMTPIQALNFVVKLQELYRESQAKSG